MNITIKKNMTEIENSLNALLKSDNYDVEKLTYSMAHQVKQLEYFYCHISKNKDNSKTYYTIKQRPQIHELAYFNLGRGFPKELMDGHWCYVLKDWGTKMLVIPATSIKDNNPNQFELDIHNYNKNGMDRISRLQLTDIRAIDVQRLDLRKDFFKTKEEDIEIIQSKLIEITIL